MALKNVKKEKLKEYYDIIKEARSNSQSNSSDTFIDSCEDYLIESGHLTEKQMTALTNIQYDEYADLWMDNLYDELHYDND